MEIPFPDSSPLHYQPGMHPEDHPQRIMAEGVLESESEHDGNNGYGDLVHDEGREQGVITPQLGAHGSFVSPGRLTTLDDCILHLE